MAGWALLAAVGIPGCRDRAAPIEEQRLPPVEPAARPESILGTFIVPEPQRTWDVLQARVSPGMPRHLRVLAALVLDVERAVIEHLDLDAPLSGALVWEGSRARLVLSLRVSRVEELRAQLTRGQEAPYSERLRGGVVGLEPIGRRSGGLALAGSHLVIAPSVEVATSVAPYLTTRLARKSERAEGDLVAELEGRGLGRALSGALHDRWATERAWLSSQATRSRASHGGRAADFGDPEALLTVADGAVEVVAGVLSELERGRFSVNVQGDVAVLRCEPEWAPGSATGRWLEALPGATHVPPVRSMSVATLFLPGGADGVGHRLGDSLLAVLGSRASDALTDSVTDLAGAADELLRGPVTTELLRFDDGRHGVSLSAAPASTHAMPDVLRHMEKVVRTPAVAEPIEAAVGGSVDVVDRVDRDGHSGELCLGSKIACAAGAQLVGRETRDSPVRLAWASGAGAMVALLGTFDVRSRLSGVSSRPAMAPNPFARVEPGDAQVLAALALRVTPPPSGALGGWVVAMASREPRSTAITVAADPVLFALMRSVTSR